MAATRGAVLFVVLEYSIKGIWLSLNAKREYKYFELCVCLKIHVIEKKTEKHIKNPAQFHYYFLQDFREMICCQMDNIPSLQSLIWAKLTSVPQRSAVFGKSSDDKYLKMKEIFI